MSLVPGRGNVRGGYGQGRGRGGWSRSFVKRQEPVKPDLAKHPLGEFLVSLRASDLRISRTDVPSSARIDDCQYVASYNWLAGKDSTILVPGQPPQWTPPNVAQKLPEDSGNFYRDPNAARYPEYPIAPAVQAVIDATSDAPAHADAFACGSTLGNLLRFVRGVDKAFRFSVEVIGDTVFLIRKENDPKELIEGVRGFGHSFPDAYTTWPAEVKGSETHQRIVQYDLGGTQCLVRFECDGFLQDGSSVARQPSSTARPPSENTLAQALSDTTISTPLANSISPLSIKQAGKMIPQSSIFDLKTRSGKRSKDINMDDITPQLWLKQIPNFIVAYHNGFGLFEDIQVQDVRSLISAFEEDNADAIRRLVMLLNKIITIAKADEKGLLEVYSPGKDLLEIRRQFGDGVHALPLALREEWMARCEAGGLELEGEDTGYGATASWSSPDMYSEEFDVGLDDSDEEKDFTACSVEECGYCGKCTY